MPKFPSLTPKQVIKMLNANGFRLKRIKGSHHFFHNPRTKAIAIVPYHNKDLPKGTLLAILKQAGLDRENLK